MGKLKDYVISLLGDDYIQATKNQYRDEIRFRCPFCEEMGNRTDDYKLYINTIDGKPKSGKYQCKRCGTTGVIRFDKFRREATSEGIQKLLESYVEPDSIYSTDDEDDETEFYLIPSDKPRPNTLAYDYILSRGITVEDMDYYNIRVPNLDSPYYLQSRFIVPNKLISNNWTDMYVARSYVGDKVRYKNPNSSAKSEIIFNYHNIEDGIENLIVNEGALNSIIAGRNSIALYGKVASIRQIEMILDKHPKNIYISLDADARKEALELCDKLVSLCDSNIYLVDLPLGLDASDLGKDKYLELVYNSNPYKSSKIYKIFASL